MTKSIIYYTDNRLSEPIFSVVQKTILAANLSIVSVSLKAIPFGQNFVLPEAPGIITLLRQITKALEESSAENVFFCEHDVLYPKSHFDFTPLRNDIFYYNAHIWRWKYPTDLAISYDRLLCLSGLCANRSLALNHYRARLAQIQSKNLQQNGRHEPQWARRWGYEPGTKKIKRGGFSDDDFETWRSPEALVDIRHQGTFSPPKVSRDSFIHQPTGWREIGVAMIPGWDVKQLFNLP